MTDQELLDWYKGGATKPENMTDQDYELTMNKALAAQKNQMLQDNLNAQQGAIAKAQTNAQQSASISNDKLMKYLGQKQLASGVASGQTGSDFINANNAYTQNRSEITNAASAQNTDLLQRYAGEKWQSDSDTFKTETGINDKYNAIARADEEKKYDREQDAWNKDMTLKEWEQAGKEWDYNVAEKEWMKEQTKIDEDYAHAREMVESYLSDFISDGNFDEAEYAKAQEMLGKYTNLGDGNIQKINDIIDYYKSNNGGNGSSASPDIKTSDAVFSTNGSGLTSDSDGDNFRVAINGNDYRVENDGKENNPDIIAKAKKLKNGSVFSYGDKLYIKHYGDICRIRGRGANETNGDYAKLYKAIYG